MTHLVKFLLCFLGITVVLTLILSCFGLWKLYSFHCDIFWTILIIYIISLTTIVFLTYRFLFCLRIDVDLFSKESKEVIDQIAKDLEVLTTNPITIIKTLARLFTLIKPQSKDAKKEK